MSTLEKIPTKSPLLSDAVIERDYTKGIESQLSGSQPSQPQQPIEPPNPASESEQAQQQAGTGFTAPGNFEEPAGFSFDQEIDDKTDAQEGEEPGISLASASAKTFANVVGDLIKIKVPEVSFNFCKIDLNSIEAHIQNGNINSALREVFQQINTGTREALEFSEDEIKMWKKAFKEYLEYKNIKGANPETAFWIATATLVVTQGIKVRELRKNNKQYIVDAINSYNPSYFDSFRAKMNKEPDKDTKEPEKKETDKTTI